MVSRAQTRVGAGHSSGSQLINQRARQIALRITIASENDQSPRVVEEAEIKTKSNQERTLSRGERASRTPTAERAPSRVLTITGVLLPAHGT